MIRYTLVTPDDLCSDPGYFPCNASYCVPKSWFCDGNVDCVGGRDEECCCKFQFFCLYANICSKSTIEALEKGVKYVQS